MTSSGSPRRDRFGASATDSAKCLLLITGYQGNARLLGQVVAAAQERMLMSPSLGDFFELRWVDLGRAPQSADRVRAGVGRLAIELTRNRPSGAARNFSAVMVFDGSSTVVARVLHECEADPVIAGLKVRLLGSARKEDRKSVRSGGPEILIAVGKQSFDDLVTEVVKYAERLLGYFGSGWEAGLAAPEVGAIGEQAQSKFRGVVQAAAKADVAASRDARPAPDRRGEEVERYRRERAAREAERLASRTQRPTGPQAAGARVEAADGPAGGAHRASPDTDVLRTEEDLRREAELREQETERRFRAEYAEYQERIRAEYEERVRQLEARVQAVEAGSGGGAAGRRELPSATDERKHPDQRPGQPAEQAREQRDEHGAEQAEPPPPEAGAQQQEDTRQQGEEGTEQSRQPGPPAAQEPGPAGRGDEGPAPGPRTAGAELEAQEPSPGQDDQETGEHEGEGSHALARMPAKIIETGAGLIARVRRDKAEGDERPLAMGVQLLQQALAHLNAAEETKFTLALSQLRTYASSGKAVEERRDNREFIVGQGLFRRNLPASYPARDFYGVLLRLSFEVPLSYQAYCAVEDLALAATSPGRPLLAAVVDAGQADIRVAAIARFRLGDDWVTGWFRSGQANVGQLVAALDGEWDRWGHADLVYQITLRRLNWEENPYKEAATRMALQAHGYLAAALRRRFPESRWDQASVLGDFLRNAYRAGLDRRAVSEIFALSRPTAGLAMAVLHLLRDEGDQRWAIREYVRFYNTFVGRSSGDGIDSSQEEELIAVLTRQRPDQGLPVGGVLD